MPVGMFSSGFDRCLVNHYAAREIQNDGKPTGLFHYTCTNKRTGVYAVGYCSPHKDCTACGGMPQIVTGKPCDACGGKGFVELPENERCKGHPTPKEACEHYRQYLLDQATFKWPRAEKWPKEKCASEGCDEEGTHLADIPGTMGYSYNFCEKHCNRDELSKKVAVGESWSS